MQSMPYYPQGYQAPQYGAPPPGAVLPNGQPMMPHPSGLPPMQHHDINGQPQKRKQVKNACTNCQKACKKCDDARPCPRCVKYGIADSCVNSVRKERKKGIKRGPYKRRQKSDSEKAAQRKPNMAEDPNGQYANAMRAPPIPYGFPGGLNQYGQPNYDYNTHYYKDQMVAPQYNVVNPMYPQIPYPVLMQNQGDGTPGSQAQPHAYQQHPSLPQHYGNMVQPPQSSAQQQPNGTPQVYYQQQPTTTPQQPSATGTPAAGEQQQSPEPKSQAMTPMPSASTSSATASSPSESNNGEEDPSKYARLSQLCTAALHQEPSGQESQDNEASTAPVTSTQEVSTSQEPVKEEPVAGQQESAATSQEESNGQQEPSATQEPTQQ
ncbi:hypothetical protein BC941DRAFT_470034 [Chlamydoabsidia padenii]|nr:hypothetical protein BC941DRAFT_470034 [Chlamydoabsidia padenii]